MQAYLTFLQTEKCVSPQTARAYLESLGQFSAFLGRDAAEAGEEDILAFMRHLQSAGRSSATILRMLSSLSTYYHYLVSIGRCHALPTANITRPALDHKLPVILTYEEAVRLLAAPAGDTPKAMRDRAMLELLYATGITVSELVGLNIENLNIRRRTLVLRRGERKRTIPFGRPCYTALNDYLKNARPHLFRGSGEVALFVSCNGTRMSRQGFWKLLKKYSRAAGLDKEITPHMLRHSFAAHLLENGADLSSIQEMMGFIDPSSTAIYTKIIENKILDVYNKAHPRAN